jgi:hypothetical protein
VTAFGPPPERPWCSYGTDPLPSGEEALDQPLRAFPSWWFLRIECEHCGAMRMISERHSPPGALTIREILRHMRHDGCGGRGGRRSC